MRVRCDSSIEAQLLMVVLLESLHALVHAVDAARGCRSSCDGATHVRCGRCCARCKIGPMFDASGVIPFGGLRSRIHESPLGSSVSTSVRSHLGKCPLGTSVPT